MGEAALLLGVMVQVVSEGARFKERDDRTDGERLRWT